MAELACTRYNVQCRGDPTSAPVYEVPLCILGRLGLSIRPADVCSWEQNTVAAALTTSSVCFTSQFLRDLLRLGPRMQRSLRLFLEAGRKK